MVSLVLELQRDAMDSSVSLTDLLRKALVVARKLGVEDFQSWITNELGGYSDLSKIPKYRKVVGEIKAWNPYHGWIPCIIQNDEWAEQLRQREIGQAIGSLVALADKKEGGGRFMIPYPPKVENALMEMAECDLRPILHVDSSCIHGILDAVRNTVLDWALRLESEGIMGEGMSFSLEEKEKARTVPRLT